MEILIIGVITIIECYCVKIFGKARSPADDKYSDQLLATGDFNSVLEFLYSLLIVCKASNSYKSIY